MILVQGFSDVGVGTSYLTSINNSFSLAPSVTKIAGRHTLKFGAELRRMDFNYAQNNVTSGTFFFDNLLTSTNPLAAAGKVSRKLTLSYGLRWELPSPFRERHDRLTVLLPNAESPLPAVTGLPLKGKLAVVNSACDGRSRSIHSAPQRSSA